MNRTIQNLTWIAVTGLAGIASADTTLLAPLENKPLPGSGTFGKALCGDLDSTGRDDLIYLRGGTLYVAHEPSAYQAITTVVSGANDFDTVRAIGSNPETLYVATSAGVYVADWDWANSGLSLPWGLTAIPGAPAATRIRIEVIGGVATLFGMDLSGDLFVMEQISGTWSTVTSGVPTITGLSGVTELLPFRLGGGTNVDTLAVLTGTELRIYPFSGGMTSYGVSGWTFQGATVVGQTADDFARVVGIATYASTEYAFVFGSSGMSYGLWTGAGPVTSVSSGHYSNTNFDDAAFYSPSTGDVTIWQDVLDSQTSIDVDVGPVSPPGTSVAVAALGDIDGDFDGDVLIGLDGGTEPGNVAVHANGQISHKVVMDDQYTPVTEATASFELHLAPIHSGLPAFLVPNRLEVIVFKEDNGVVDPDQDPASYLYDAYATTVDVGLGFTPYTEEVVQTHFMMRYIKIDENTNEILAAHEPSHLVYYSAEPEDPNPNAACTGVINLGGACWDEHPASIPPSYSREDKVGSGGGGVPGGNEPPPPFP